MMWGFRRRRRDVVSLGWLREQQRRESRVEYQGVAIRFPIEKLKDGAALWQTRKLKRRA